MKKRRTIALVMNELTDYSYEISVGAQSLFAAQGYDCIAITGKHLDDPRSKSHNSIYQLIDEQLFAGALFYSYTLENNRKLPHLHRLLGTLAPLPIISVGAKLPAYKSIVVDHHYGMTLLMDHLIAQARHRKFLFVRGLLTNVDSALRETIFCNRLRTHGLLAEADFITGSFDGDVVYKEICTRFRVGISATTPTAIVCANDRMAVAAIEALVDSGLRVPEDIVVTGFDNSLECENSRVPLTTVGQPLHTMGEKAAQMLLDQLAGIPVDDHAVPTELVLRSSCGAVKAVSATTVAHALSAKTGLHQQPVSLKRRDYLSHLVTNLNVKLMEQTELSGLKAELLTLFPRLGISRCCIVLHEAGQRSIGAPARIFISYDETNPTRSESSTAEVFDSNDFCHSLDLMKLQFGSLCELMPLVVSAECFGYMIFEWETYYFTDFLTLPVTISGALRNIYQLQSLQEYAQSLAHKVEERTEELHLTNRRLQFEVNERRNSELALRAANEKLQWLASIDGLTRLANRTALDDYLLRLCAVQPESAAPLSMLLCDIDYFKRYNDTYGHQAGDECLQAVAQVLQKFTTQPTAMAARYGGEELVVLVPGLNERSASRVAEELLRTVSALSIPHCRSTAGDHITISIGLITIPPRHPITAKELIAHADLALYQAKLNGRNQYAAYQDDRANLLSSHCNNGKKAVGQVPLISSRLATL